jgi:hypothetical protein
VSNTPPYQGEDKLATLALEKVRALCKGNGIKIDSVTISQHDIRLHTLHAHTYLELKPVMNERVAPGKVVVGSAAGSRAEAVKQIDQSMISAANNQAIRLQITNMLLSRPDKGFGMPHYETIPLDFLKQEYTYHDTCGTCRGSGSSVCRTCSGRRVEACTKCSGRGLMLCPLCRGMGLINGQRCTRCQGHRYYPCDVCRKTGSMRCRSCAGSGQMKCATCGGQGSKSNIISMTVHAMSYFQYEAKSIPKGAADVIESEGSKVALNGRVKIEGRAAEGKENENVLGASYEVTFPYGEMTLTIAKKEIKIGVFGYNADLVNAPTFIDRLIQKGLRDLEEASQGVGSVPDKIRNATKFRVIANGFLLASKTTPQKGAEKLLKKYYTGLSVSTAEMIVRRADQAMALITKKPRFQGMMMGLGASVILSAVYYLAPVRSYLAANLPDPRIDIILDAIVIGLSGYLTGYVTQKVAAGSVQMAIGHLLKPDKKKTLVPKLGRGIWIGYIGAAIFALIMMSIAQGMNKPVPFWFQLIMQLFA